MKRPLGITLVALLLASLSAGAFVLAMTAETLAATGARWRLVQVGALVYGLAAAVAALGLWKLRRWGYVAFVGWVATVLAIGLWWPAAFQQFTLPQWGDSCRVAIARSAVDSMRLGNQERRALRSLGLGYAALAVAALVLYLSVDTD
jgi:uncharacterized membrane protein (DUF2068 family)